MVQLGDEIGYYDGIIKTISLFFKYFPNSATKEEKLVQTIQKLTDLISLAQNPDPYSNELNDQAEEIRRVFKKIAAFLKIKVRSQTDEI